MYIKTRIHTRKFPNLYIYIKKSFIRGVSRFKFCGKRRMSLGGLNQLFPLKIKFVTCNVLNGT